MIMGKFNRGDSDTLFIIGIAALLLVFLIGGRNFLNIGGTGFLSIPGGPSVFESVSRSDQSIQDPNSSYWRGKVSLSPGNVYEIQPYLEYVTINAGDVGESGVNISGWYLTNNKGQRRVQFGGNDQYFASDKAVIPYAAKLFLTNNSNYLSPVVLHSGGSAILITGSFGNRSPFQVTSFQVNKCSGYLENVTGYDFHPPLSQSCPVPSKEVGADALQSDCYDFVKRMPYCHKPEMDKFVKVNGVEESGYVDGVGGLSNQCKTYLQAHYSYEGCLAYHATEEDFYKNEWRIFLNNSWELWGKDREVITLYDSSGKVVDQVSY